MLQHALPPLQQLLWLWGHGYGDTILNCGGLRDSHMMRDTKLHHPAIPQQKDDKSISIMSPKFLAKIPDAFAMPLNAFSGCRLVSARFRLGDPVLQLDSDDGGGILDLVRQLQRGVAVAGAAGALQRRGEGAELFRPDIA